MIKKYHILFVEDEPSLSMLVKENLIENNYEVTHSGDGETAIKSFFEVQPDLVILDVMIPKVNGFSVARTIRNTDRKTPILFLTAKIHTKDLIKGFEAGGNDYIKKPFSMEELLIRMKAMLANDRLADLVAESEEKTFDLGDYFFDSNKMLIKHESGLVKKLTFKEAELLKLLCQNRNEVLTKKSILYKVWGDDSFLNSRSMDVFISRLRKYLQRDPTINLVNIRGIGYKLIVNLI